MLCDLAHSFPPKVAELLERDGGLKRNFREESVTDLLMASLIGLEPFGIRVDFPDEPSTGGDMDWIFAAPHDIGGGRYLRIILQAKRAQFAKAKGGYWYYHHLDHDKGRQAQTLMAFSGSAPGGISTLPLYIFYHPSSALLAKSATKPAVEGINLVFAHQIAPVVAGGCKRDRKMVDIWRGSFMPLSDILCWPFVRLPRAISPSPPGTIGFQINGGPRRVLPIAPAFHPDVVAARLERRFESLREKGPIIDISALSITATDNIPNDIRRAIDGEVTSADRKEISRPRVIFSTTMTRDHPSVIRAVGRSGN